MNSSFECISTLQYRLKAAENQIAAFKSGKKYIQMNGELVSIFGLNLKMRTATLSDGKIVRWDKNHWQ